MKILFWADIQASPPPEGRCWLRLSWVFFISLLTKWMNTWLKMLSDYNVTLSIINNRQVGIAAGTHIRGQDMPVGWKQLLHNKEQFTLF